MNIHDAMIYLYPDKKWSINGDNYDGLEWYENTECPTENEITQAWSNVENKINAINEIVRLELLETPRRIAEAALTQEGKDWLQSNRELIAIERLKL